MKQFVFAGLLLLGVVIAAAREKHISITPKQFCDACQMLAADYAVTHLGYLDRMPKQMQENFDEDPGAERKKMEVELPWEDKNKMKFNFCEKLKKTYVEEVAYGCFAVVDRQFEKIQQTLTKGMNYDQLNSGTFTRKFMYAICDNLEGCRVDQAESMARWKTKKCAHCMTVAKEIKIRLGYMDNITPSQLKEAFMDVDKFCEKLPHKYENKGQRLTEICQDLLENQADAIVDKYSGRSTAGMEYFPWVDKLCVAEGYCKKSVLSSASKTEL